MRQTTKFVLVVAACVAAACAYGLRSGPRENYMTFNENLDKVVANVDGDDIYLRDLAFYLAYEEGMMEKYANIYDDEDTGAFWRIASNRMFLRVESKDAVMDMAVHDIIFCELAKEESLTLNEEEQKLAEDAGNDFWSDLEEEQREALGVEKEQIGETISRIALAEKYQTILAGVQGEDYDNYSFQGDAYERILEEHEVTVYKDVWKKVNFGGITVNH